MVIGCYLSSNECFADLPEMEVGSSDPGCLTSEDEERETWTAESLRAAILDRRSGFERSFVFEREEWPDETSAVDVSGQHQFRANGVFAVR